MSIKKIVIIGAGLTGLSAAWHLNRQGLDCAVFEKEEEVGGLCRSKYLQGFTFDHDGHLLHFRDKPVFALLNTLLGGNIVKHKTSAWVDHSNKRIPYPFQANLRSLPKDIGRECFIGFLKRRAFKKDKRNSFVNWANYNFGPAISKHFLFPYNRKFWSVALKELTSDWAERFVPVPFYEQVLHGMFKGDNHGLGYNAYFYYPKAGGIDCLARAFAVSVERIITGVELVSLNMKRRQAVFSDGRKVDYDQLVSTVPLPQLGRIITDAPEKLRLACRKLRWNSVFNMNFGLKHKTASGEHWVYFPEKRFAFFRLGFAHNFSPTAAPRSSGSVYAEVAYSKEKPIDRLEVARKVVLGLRSLKIIKDEKDILCRHFNDIRYAYPVFDGNYRSSRKTALDILARNNIISCGRYGSWIYASMEDAILEGKRAAYLTGGAKR